jgi:hypothetical protein
MGLLEERLHLFHNGGVFSESGQVVQFLGIFVLI